MTPLEWTICVLVVVLLVTMPWWPSGSFGQDD